MQTDNDSSPIACGIHRSAGHYHLCAACIETGALTDEVAALRAERDDLRVNFEAMTELHDAKFRDWLKSEADGYRMRPVFELVEQMDDVIEWLPDDSARTEEWEQAWWDVKEGLKAYRATSEQETPE